VLPKGVEVTIEGQQITIKGKKGSLSYNLRPEVEIKLENNKLEFTPSNNSRLADMQAGTARALVNNMVVGTHQGFEKKLTLVGVGYRAQVQGKILNLTLGYSHPINFSIPEGITIESPSQTDVLVKGIDRQLVGQVASNIRNFRSPEPYKGKGVRYTNEVIELKETKKK
jgi:large subunit ribosomal protein L6